MRYLRDDPISITLTGGQNVWLKYDEDSPLNKGKFQFLVDMRPLVKAIPVEKLPKSITRRMVPEICRSKVQETYSENYMSVLSLAYHILTLTTVLFDLGS